MWKISRGYQQHLWTPNTIRCGKGSLLNAWSEWWWCWDAQMLRFWIDWDGQRASGSFSFGLVAAVLKFPVGYSEKINMFINSLKVDSLRERVWFNVLFFCERVFQISIFNWTFFSIGALQFPNVLRCWIGRSFSTCCTRSEHLGKRGTDRCLRVKHVMCHQVDSEPDARIWKDIWTDPNQMDNEMTIGRTGSSHWNRYTLIGPFIVHSSSILILHCLGSSRSML